MIFKILAIPEIIASQGKCVCHPGLRVKRVTFHSHRTQTCLQSTQLPHLFQLEHLHNVHLKILNPYSLQYIFITCCSGPFCDHECGLLMLLAHFYWACVPPSAPPVEVTEGLPVSDSEVKAMGSPTSVQAADQTIPLGRVPALALLPHHRTFTMSVTYELLPRPTAGTWPFDEDLSVFPGLGSES